MGRTRFPGVLRSLGDTVTHHGETNNIDSELTSQKCQPFLQRDFAVLETFANCRSGILPLHRQITRGAFLSLGRRIDALASATPCSLERRDCGSEVYYAPDAAGCRIYVALIGR